MDSPGSQGDDSPIIWTGRPAWSTYLWLWIFCAILGIRGVVSFSMGYRNSALFHIMAIGLLAMLAVLLRSTSRYRLTRQAIYRSKGFVGKAEQSFPISSVSSVSEKRSPLERFTGSGDLVLHLKNGVNERLTGLKHPEILRRKIEALL